MRLSKPLAAVLLLGLAIAAISRLSADPPNTTKEPAPSVIRSARSGPWSAPATWEGGKVPAAGARVLIRNGHRVVYDVNSEAVLRGVNVAGTLTFAADRDTRLDV